MLKNLRNNLIGLALALLALLMLTAPPLQARELTSNVSVVLSHGAQSSSTAVTSAAISLVGYGEAMIIVNSGVTAATGTLDIKAQSSATSGGTYADITGAAFTQITPSNDVAVYVGRLKVNPSEPHIKIVATAATAASLYAIQVVRGNPHSQTGPVQTPQWTATTTD